MPQTNKLINASASGSTGSVEGGGPEDAEPVAREKAQVAGDGGEDNVGDSEIIKSPSDPKQYR